MQLDFEQICYENQLLRDKINEIKFSSEKLKFTTHMSRDRIVNRGLKKMGMKTSYHC